MNMRLVLAPALLAIAGCAATAPSVDQSPVKPATADQVAACTYLDDVTAAVGLYGIFADQGIASARGQVLQQAAQRGATHLVWTGQTSTYGQSTASGKAYRCS